MTETKEEDKGNWKIGVAVIIIIISITTLTFLLSHTNTTKNDYSDFAVCLSDKAKLYGAWWCPHCNEQKEAFGNAWQLFSPLGYVECSTEDKQQTEACKNQNISGYPTWIFNDGSRLAGKLEFKVLAEKTGCVLP